MFNNNKANVWLGRSEVHKMVIKNDRIISGYSLHTVEYETNSILVTSKGSYSVKYIKRINGGEELIWGRLYSSVFNQIKGRNAIDIWLKKKGGKVIDKQRIDYLTF